MAGHRWLTAVGSAPPGTARAAVTCGRVQAVDDELGNQLVATMLYLDSENKKDIQMYINASGGHVVPCLALHDTMKHIGSDVATVGFGGVMGMAGFLLACGTPPLLLPTLQATTTKTILPRRSVAPTASQMTD